MSVEWKGLSESAWHHPGMAFALCGVAAAVVVIRIPDGPLRRVLLAFTALTALDAWLTGTQLAQNVSIAFVILGDARLFVLLERFRADRRWGLALGVMLSFVVLMAEDLEAMLGSGLVKDGTSRGERCRLSLRTKASLHAYDVELELERVAKPYTKLNFEGRADELRKKQTLEALTGFGDAAFVGLLASQAFREADDKQREAVLAELTADAQLNGHGY